MQQVDLKDIGKRIQTQRELLGYTRERMAEALDITAKFCADIELGHKGMSIQTLYSISQYLGITTDYILTGKDDNADIEEKIKPLTKLMATCKPEKLKYAEAIMRDFLSSLD